MPNISLPQLFQEIKYFFAQGSGANFCRKFLFRKCLTLTLRFYEEAGLIDSHRKGSYREYDRAQCQRLEIILLLRRLTFSLKEITKLLNGEMAGFREMLPEKISKSSRAMIEARETDRLLRDLAARLEVAPAAAINVAEMLAQHVYLTKQTEGVVKMSNLGDHLVLIGRNLVDDLVNENAGDLLGKIARLRADLEAQGITLPMIRLRDSLDLAPSEAQILWYGEEVWRKDYKETNAADCADELIGRLRAGVSNK